MLMEHRVGAGQIGFLGQVQTGPNRSKQVQTCLEICPNRSNFVKNIGENVGEIEVAAKPSATREAQVSLKAV